MRSSLLKFQKRTTDSDSLSAMLAEVQEQLASAAKQAQENSVSGGMH